MGGGVNKDNNHDKTIAHVYVVKHNHVGFLNPCLVLNTETSVDF